MSDAGLPVSKPISAWNKPLQADWKAMFKALARGSKSGVLGKWEELPGAGVDLLSAVGLKTSHGERAYLLIRRALTAAIHELVSESIPNFQRFEGDEQELVETFDWSLEGTELRIGRRFFEHPADLTIVNGLKAPLSGLLAGLGLNVTRAKTVSQRLGTSFTFHLAQEWRDHPTVYGSLREALEGPFAEATEREEGWILYDAWLQKQAAQPVFGESFSLTDIYIPLRGYWLERQEEGGEALVKTPRVSRDGETQVGDQPTRHAVELHQEIESWLEAEQPMASIRLLSGGPGSGKSTFAKMLAATVSRRGSRRVLYVPLHLLDPSADLMASIDGFVTGDRFLSINPLHPKQGEPRVLVIFDGLDELSQQGKVGAEVASQFVGEVRATVDRLSAQGADLRVLITGRPVAVDAQRNLLRLPDQLLHVLPYEIPKDERGLFSNPETLAEDQRDLWWRRYGECVSKSYDGLPKKLQRPDLAEITRQPLLNYLLALSYERGEIDFSRGTSLNEIYGDLLDAVYERQWGPGGPHPAVGRLDKEHFGRILEEIAVAAWHGNGRTTTVQEIKNRFESMGLLPLLDHFEEGAKEGVGRLLLAFYFRRAGRREAGDPTFEFTHKSFGEYLVARRLTGMVETIQRQLAARKKDFEVGWDERSALERWVTLTGPTPLEANLLEFLRREVALHGEDSARDWQKCLAELLSRELEAGLPMERIEPRLTYHRMTRWARNAEETLLASLDACSRITRKLTHVGWPGPTTLGELIARLRGQRSSPFVLALDCLGYLDATETSLFLCDLYCARLRGAHLSRAYLFAARLQQSDLRKAELREAHLLKADLREADLQKADLREAYLQQADLREAYLREADLRGANLWRADLRRADLRRADLREADLREVDLQQADLREADLRRADLQRANLRGADLRGADIRGASLHAARIWSPGTEQENLSQLRLTAQQFEELDLPIEVRGMVTIADLD